MKSTKLFFSTLTLSVVLASTAFAGTWKTGAEPNQSKWWYDNGDGTYTNNGWQWIDGNNDGTAESYYFDTDGWLLTNTTTPDGHQVNADGAWINNGAVETKAVAAQNSEAGATSHDYRGYYEVVAYQSASDGNVYHTIEPDEGIGDFNVLEVSAFDGNSITFAGYEARLYDKAAIIYNKAADNKYYPADAEAYFDYVYFDGELIAGYHSEMVDSWTQYFAKNEEISAVLLSNSDFIVSGDDEITKITLDNNWVTFAKKRGFWGWCQTYDESASVTTNRGIAFPSKRDDVMNAYGDTTINTVDLDKDDAYAEFLVNGMIEFPDTQKIFDAATYVEYQSTTSEKIRFYFDSSDNLILLVYGLAIY